MDFNVYPKNWPYIYAINLLKQYLFGLIVTAYVVSVAGIPIYKHYCGGELEKVNYVLKSNSCCGGEEDDASDTGCCTDENIIVKNTPDFTIKNLANYDLVKSFSEVFYVSLPFLESDLSATHFTALNSLESPPPRLQNSLIISTSVLRI